MRVRLLSPVYGLLYETIWRVAAPASDDDDEGDGESAVLYSEILKFELIIKIWTR